MDHNKQLQCRTVGYSATKAVRLGDALADLMADCDRQHRSHAGQLPQLWADLLPAELAGHTRLNGLSQGCLTIEVDSPAYLYELRLCAGQLVRRLSEICPAAGIRNLKLVIAPAPYASAEKKQLL